MCPFMQMFFCFFLFSVKAAHLSKLAALCGVDFLFPHSSFFCISFWCITLVQAMLAHLNDLTFSKPVSLFTSSALPVLYQFMVLLTFRFYK